VKRIKPYEGAFEQLETTVSEAFNQMSYVRRKELGLPMGSDDVYEGVEVSEEEADKDTVEI
jgi:hypothetical protein